MKSNFERLFVSLLLLSVLVCGAYCQCTINIRTDLIGSSNTIREPLFLKYSGSQYELMIPDDGFLNFKKDQRALIACTSDTRKNSLIFNNNSNATISCVSGSTFNANNIQYSISDISECSASISGNVINYNLRCGHDGILMNIGYQLTDKRDFVNLIRICYSKSRGSAIYAQHTIQGVSVKNKMIANQRPSTFKSTEVPSKFKPENSFKRESQQKRLEEIFGSITKAKKYINKTYLARGHLSPDGDMIFASWQWSTYYFINVVPQWQSINNANWKAIENSVRSKAAQLKRDVLVITGGFQVLQLENKNIMLESDGIEVPKWTWKVVKDPMTGNGIAFVTYNNPFVEDVNDLCNDICDKNGWNWDKRKHFFKGYTICCDVGEVMRIISDIPPEARCNGILQK